MDCVQYDVAYRAQTVSQSVFTDTIKSWYNLFVGRHIYNQQKLLVKLMIQLGNKWGMYNKNKTNVIINLLFYYYNYYVVVWQHVYYYKEIYFIIIQKYQNIYKILNYMFNFSYMFSMEKELWWLNKYLLEIHLKSHLVQTKTVWQNIQFLYTF